MAIEVKKRRRFEGLLKKCPSQFSSAQNPYATL